MKLLMVTSDTCDELVKEGYQYLVTRNVHDKNEFGSLKDLVTLMALKKSNEAQAFPICEDKIGELLSHKDRQYYVMLND